jgi:CRP-like cAMP-binding protein
MSANSSQSLNHLLVSLPVAEYQNLSPHFLKVSLDTGTILYEPYETIDSIYFIEEGLVSLVSVMENGATTEVGLVCREGIIGLPLILGSNYSSCRAIVHIAGSALRIDANILKQEFDRGGELQRLLLLYTQARLTQVSQIAACNGHHIIEQRLARWLLSVQDCLGQDQFLLSECSAHDPAGA